LMPADWYVRAQRFRSYFHAEIGDAFVHHDVLVAAATPYPATPIGATTIAISCLRRISPIGKSEKNPATTSGSMATAKRPSHPCNTTRRSARLHGRDAIDSCQRPFRRRDDIML